MFAKNSLASLIIVVVFLVLTSMAIILYGGDNQKKAELEQNAAWRQARSIADWGLAFITGADKSTTRGSGQTEGDNSAVIQEENNNIKNNLNNLASSTNLARDAKGVLIKNGVGIVSQDGSTSSLSAVMSDFKNEWEAVKENPAKIDVSKKSWDDFIAWEKTATGASLIIKSKGEEKYRLLLPFKFLGN